MKNAQQPQDSRHLFIFAIFLLVPLFFSSIAGFIWGVPLSIIISSIIIVALKNEQENIVLTIIIFLWAMTIIALLKLWIKTDFNLINSINYSSQTFKFILNHIKKMSFYNIYEFSINNKEKYLYSWVITFLIPSIGSLIIYKLVKKEALFKGLKNLKKGKITEKKDKIPQNKLYELCRKKVNPLRDEIGVEVNTGKVLTIPDKVLNTILLVLGKTGAGKTEALKNFYYRTITRKQPLIIINAKPDKKLELELKKWCAAAGTKFNTFGCLSEDNYNFLNNGKHTALTDKIMSLNNVWDNTFFKNRANTYIQNAIYILQQTKKEENLTLEHFINLFDKTKLEKIVNDYEASFSIKKESSTKEIMEDEFGFSDDNDVQQLELQEIKDSTYNPRIKKYFDLLSNFDEEQLAGLKDIFTILYTSEMSESLSSGDKNRKSFSLEEVIKNKEVVYFSLNVLEYPQFAPLVGKVAMNDIKAIISNRPEADYKSPIFLFMDEFSAFASEQAINIVNMGRGFGLHTCLGTQGLADLDDVSETFKEKVMSNVTALLVHTAPDPKSAEYICNWVGTKQAIIETARQDDTGLETGSLRQGAEFIINPNELKRELGGGKAFYIDNNRKIEAKIQVALVNEQKVA